MNPMGIAVTVVSKDGNLLASKLIGNLVKKAFRWLRGHGVNTSAIEDLDIKKTLDEGVPHQMKVGQQGIEVALGGPSNPLKAR
ncbi:MAG: hypothetical protein DRJ49_06485, partial [Thermoprotei archaeon]